MTMASFPKSNGTRLAQVRALGGDFPFYGPMETDAAGRREGISPGRASALSTKVFFCNSARRSATHSGSANLNLRLSARSRRRRVKRPPPASFAPRVYIPLQNLVGDAAFENREPRALPRFREVSGEYRCGSADHNARSADQATRARLRHRRGAKAQSRQLAGKSVSFSKPGWLHLAASRRGRGGERHPGPPPAENEDRRDSALPRAVLGGRGLHLPGPNRGDGPFRRRRRRHSWHRDATSASGHSDVVPAADHFDLDGLAADRGRRSHRLFHLHSVCACRRCCVSGASRRCASFAPVWKPNRRRENAIPSSGWFTPRLLPGLPAFRFRRRKH